MIEVSVIMSVYNSEKYIKESIESILKQTYKNFEFIIISDGSTDSSLDIIKKYNDKRIKLIENSKNMGLIYSLNKALSISRGKYIIRMDSDDIAREYRIEKQVEYMEKNKEVDIAGSKSILLFENKLKKSRCILGREEIRTTLLFNNCISHPTVIMRKSSLKKNNILYKEEYIGCEDYGMWAENIDKLIIENMNEELLYYRIVENGVTQTLNKKIKEKYNVISKLHQKLIKKLYSDLKEEELILHFKIGENNFEGINAKELKSYFNKLLENNKNYYNSYILKKIMGKKWIKLCLYRKKIYLSKYLYYGIIQGGKEICHSLKKIFY